MNRTQILERIAELDRKINQKIDAKRSDPVSLRHRRFPWGAWSTVIVLLLIWVFFPDINNFFQNFGPELPGFVNLIILGLALLFTLTGIYHTLMWLMKGRQKHDRKYMEHMKEVNMMQKERENLQKQLEKTKE